MTRTLTTPITQENNLKFISNLLTGIAIVIVFIGFATMIWVNLKMKELEKAYPPTIVIDFRERMSAKEEAKLYIQSLEVPLEECVYEEESIEVQEGQEDLVTLVDDNSINYNPTDEERWWAYRIAKSEAGIEDDFGKTLVINVAINSMRAKGRLNLVEEFTAPGRYSSVIDGVPCIPKDGELIPVTDDMLSDELKAAVDAAFEKDYTEEILKEEAVTKGLDKTYYEGGALYFYNPKAVSEHQAELRASIKVSFEYGRHIFYRVWDKQ